MSHDIDAFIIAQTRNKGVKISYLLPPLVSAATKEEEEEKKRMTTNSDALQDRASLGKETVTSSSGNNQSRDDQHRSSQAQQQQQQQWRQQPWQLSPRLGMGVVNRGADSSGRPAWINELKHVLLYWQKNMALFNASLIKQQEEVDEIKPWAQKEMDRIETWMKSNVDEIKTSIKSNVDELKTRMAGEMFLKRFLYAVLVHLRICIRERSVHSPVTTKNLEHDFLVGYLHVIN